MTNTKLTILDEQMKQNAEDHKEIRKSIDEIKIDQKSGFLEINRKLDAWANRISNSIGTERNSSDIKYAVKQTEDDVKGLSNRVWGILTGLLLAALGFVIWYLENIGELHIK